MSPQGSSPFSAWTPPGQPVVLRESWLSAPASINSPPQVLLILRGAGLRGSPSPKVSQSLPFQPLAHKLWSSVFLCGRGSELIPPGLTSGQDFPPFWLAQHLVASGQGNKVPRGRASGGHSGTKGNDEEGGRSGDHPASEDALGGKDPRKVPAEIGGAEPAAPSPLRPAQSHRPF